VNDFDNVDDKLYGVIKLQNNDKKPEISGIFLTVGYTCAIAGS
jgi:hypothetical protein